MDAGELRENAWVLAAESCERWERDNEGFVTGERGHCSVNYLKDLLGAANTSQLLEFELEAGCLEVVMQSVFRLQLIDFEQHQQLKRLIYSVNNIHRHVCGSFLCIGETRNPSVLSLRRHLGEHPCCTGSQQLQESWNNAIVEAQHIHLNLTSTSASQMHL